MKIAKFVAAAGLVIAAMGVSSAANADYHHDRRGWNDNHRHHPVCHSEWRHHHRVRVCR